MTLQLTLPYSDNKPISPVFLDVGVVSAKLKMNLGAAHELVLEITPDLGEAYDLLKNPDRIDLGIKLRTNDGLEMDFIKNQNNQKDNIGGSTTVGFYSDIYRIKKNRPNRFNEVFTGQISNFISSIDNTVNFILRSANNENTITAGLTNNYDLLSEAVQAVGNWNWVQVWNTGGKTTVEYGDFRGDDVGFEARVLPTSVGFPNTIIPIESVDSRDFLGDENTIVIPYVVPGGQGADPSSTIYITDPGAITRPNERFPVFESGFTQNGKPIYWIKDVQASQVLGEQYTFFEFEMTDGFSDEGNLEISPAQAQNRLYFQAIGFLRKQFRSIRWNYTLKPRTIILPGSRVRVIAKKDQQFLDGKRVLYDIDEVQYIKEIEYDLAEIYQN